MINIHLEDKEKRFIILKYTLDTSNSVKNRWRWFFSSYK